MKKFLDEFKAFALRGNVVDLAIGVLIGGAFTTLVGALTDDIINPILAIFGTDTQLGWTIPLPGGSSGILIGAFISAVINFFIMALIIFLIMKSLNKIASLGEKKKEEAPAAPTTKMCPRCKMEIHIDATRCPHCTSEIE